MLSAMPASKKSSLCRLDEKCREGGRAHTASGFRVYFSDRKFLSEFENIRAALLARRGEILSDNMDAPRRKRFVLKTEVAGTPVVCKRELFLFRFDRTCKAFLLGADAVNIFKISERARAHGFEKIPRAFLAAEKFSFGVLRETILVSEFLTGASPSRRLSREQAEEMAALMKNAHSAGIVSGDVHPGNFIATSDGLKLIDFRGRNVFPWLAKARDRIQLERVFGLKVRNGGVAEKLFLIRNSFRNLFRRLCGKPSIPD